jgi:hypothetical protein
MVSELFKRAGLLPRGPVKWRAPVSEASPGVYVVAVTEDPSSNECPVSVDYLDSVEAARWIATEPIVYIGCTTRSLSKRLSEVYGHQYGKRAPHSGGQSVKLLRCDLWVYWSPSSDPFDSELSMICAFKGSVGRLPFANRNLGQLLKNAAE